MIEQKGTPTDPEHEKVLGREQIRPRSRPVAVGDPEEIRG